MRNLRKILLLIVIFPVIILLSSVFAEKSVATKCTQVPYTGYWYCLGKGQYYNQAQCDLDCGELPSPTPTPTPTSVPLIIPTPVCNYFASPDRCGSNSQWCLDGTCTSCSSGYLNCDQTQGCETPGNSCLTPTPTPIPPTPFTATLKWTLYTTCLAPTSPPAASTVSCGNETCYAGETCIGRASDPTYTNTYTFCIKKNTGELNSYCGTPNKNPNSDACRSKNCDSTLHCVSQPAGPTNTPVPTLAPGVPTPTLIPVRLFTPSPTQPVTPTPTPTPDLWTSCSPDNPHFASTKPWNYQYQCLSSCNNGWAEVSLSNLNCSSNTICCYKAPPGFEKTSSPGGPSPSPAVSSNNTLLAISLDLEGISIEKGANNIPKGNPNPKTTVRHTAIYLFDTNQVTTTKTGQPLTYEPTSGLFKGTVNLGPNFPGGNHLVKIKSERYLKRLLPGIVNITSGQTITIPTLTLLAGDVNGDNNIDALDYNIFVSCFGPKATTASCTNKATADVNDDGVVDGVDYNLFIHSLAIRKGD